MKPALLAALLAFHALSSALAEDAKADAVAREIDALLRQDWAKHGLQGNAPASDTTFVRRAYLDIVGRIPTLDEAEAFLSSQEPAKRAALIDHLLASDGHAQHLFHFFADLLRVQSRANGAQGDMTSRPYLEHLKKRLRENTPYDALVRELVSAQGKVWDNPAIGYYMRDLGMPLENLANTVRVFLGTRIECAQCHNDPFDKWTQRQFYQMAAYTYPLETNFTGIAEQQQAEKLRRQAQAQRDALLKSPDANMRAKAEKENAEARWMGRVFENLGDFVRYSKVQALPERVLKLPHDYQYSDAKPHDLIAPATMLGQPAPCEAGASTVEAYARWLTSPENPRFTVVIANRLWRSLFGRGLIEPVDELRDDTVASHPALMHRLTQLMRDSRYDLRAYLRVLLRTQAYQSQVTTRELFAGEDYRFTGPLLRRMSAEQIWDSLVTLVQPTPDLPHYHGIDPEQAQRLKYRGKLSDALDLLSAQEIYQGALSAGAAYEAIAARSKVLRDDYTAAQKRKDKKAMERLNHEIRATEFTARSSINEHVVLPAVARLYTRKTGQPAPPPIIAPPPPPGDAEALKKATQQRPYIDIPGYQLGDEIERGQAEAKAARLAIFESEAQRFGMPAEARPAYMKAREAQAQEWRRAADLDSPAPRGHYLREFGQSDRDFIDNANHEASMPQALVLMNSPLAEQVLSQHTQLRLQADRVKGQPTWLDTIFMTLLTRPASAREHQAWQAAQQHGASELEDIVVALLNTQQFLFVQ